jgi:hypothetical protein
MATHIAEIPLNPPLPKGEAVGRGISPVAGVAAADNIARYGLSWTRYDFPVVPGKKAVLYSSFRGKVRMGVAMAN